MTLAPLGIPGKLSPTALALPEDLTYEQWEEVGGCLLYTSDAADE